MVEIKITVHEDGRLNIYTSEKIDILSFLQDTFCAQLATMNSFIEQLPEKAVDEVKADLYDKYNFAASTLLEKFAPEIEMRPNLTVEAISKLENKIAMEAIENKNASAYGAKEDTNG